MCDGTGICIRIKRDWLSGVLDGVDYERCLAVISSNSWLCRFVHDRIWMHGQLLNFLSRSATFRCSLPQSILHDKRLERLADSHSAVCYLSGGAVVTT